MAATRDRDLRIERSIMALAELRYWSSALQKATAAMVLLPEQADSAGPYSVLYLLHGLGGDYTDWLRLTSIERYVQGWPLIVVMPDGGRSWYVDAIEGPAYDTAITRDLVGLIDRTFRTDARREARVLGGFSMGGSGALKLAISHPDLFCGASCHAGWWGPGWANLSPDISDNPETRRLSGPLTPWAAHPNNPYVYMEAASRRTSPAPPAVRLDCGAEDPNLEENRWFHAYLESIGIVHEYAEYPGSHNYGYVDACVQDALEFHARVLGLDTVPCPGTS
jgi:S-formylglutathione hydrolase FrmB